MRGSWNCGAKRVCPRAPSLSSFSHTDVASLQVRAFCVHTDQQRGLALRRKLNFDTRLPSDPTFKEWVDGVTDEVRFASCRCMHGPTALSLFVANVAFCKDSRCVVDSLSWFFYVLVLKGACLNFVVLQTFPLFLYMRTTQKQQPTSPACHGRF
jgi:hypothetical protein